MENFSSLGSQLREETKVTEGGRGGLTLAIQNLTIFLSTSMMNFLIPELVEKSAQNLVDISFSPNSITSLKYSHQ